MARRLVYVVTEDWYFMGHRLPMAQAAQAAGFDVHVITRVDRHGTAIEELGFTLHAIDWSRKSLSPHDTIRSIVTLRRKLQAIAPSIVHNIALKPAFLGTLACAGLGVHGIVNSINGLGSAFLGTTWRGTALRRGLGAALPALLNRRNVVTVVQNPDDQTALEMLGVRSDRIELIRGSGVDTDVLRALPEPSAPPVRVGFVGRMLEDKGVRPLVEAIRMLRRDGVAIELLLAGTPDPENPTSITTRELEQWAGEAGIVWAGHVDDIAMVWARSHIAALPSRREGLPKSLLEAAACGRPMVATDAPGCREVVVAGETGLLVPIDDAASLAQALGMLAQDAPLRIRFGRRAREMAEQRFSSAQIGRQTATLYLRLAE